MAEQHEISKLLIDKISYGFQFKDNTIRGTDMSERNLSVVTMAQLYEELRRRKYPVTPEATVAYIEGLEDRIADLECVRNTLTQTVSAVLAERDEAKARVLELSCKAKLTESQRDSYLGDCRKTRAIADHERMLRDMAETRAKELEERIRCGQDKLTKQQVRAMAAEKRAKDLEARVHQLCAQGAQRHSPKPSAAVEPCTAYSGYGILAAASGPQDSAKALHRAMGAPDIAGPAARVEDD